MSKGDKRTFKIVSPQVGRDGCSFYRVKQLIHALNEIEDVEAVIMKPEIDEDTQLSIYQAADIVLLRPGYHDLQRFILENSDAKIVFDHDDNVFIFPSYAPEYKQFGIEEIFDKGIGKWLWQDGKNGFDIEGNKRNLANTIWQAKHSHLYTTTTEKMLEVYSAPEVAVIPNAINFDIYPQLELKEKDEVRIGWQGGSTHYQDLQPIMPIIKRLMDKFPNVKFINEGQYFSGLFKDIDSERVETYGWIETSGFSWRAVCLDLDISLAPLAPLVFNDYKSAIKFYHAGACKVPLITPNSLPHNKEIIDGETGVLYNGLDEFEGKLGELIVDKLYRKAIGINAYNWVKNNRDIDRIARQALFTYKAICGYSD